MIIFLCVVAYFIFPIVFVCMDYVNEGNNDESFIFKTSCNNEIVFKGFNEDEFVVCAFCWIFWPIASGVYATYKLAAWTYNKTWSMCKNLMHKYFIKEKTK